MSLRPHPIRPLLALAGLALALLLPPSAGAQESITTSSGASTTPASQPAPGEAPSAPGETAPPSSSSSSSSSTTTMTTTGDGAPAPASPQTGEAGTATGPESAPQVESQHAQRVTPSRPARKRATGAKRRRESSAATGGKSSQSAGGAGGAPASEPRAGRNAPAPSTLTPSLPFALAEPIAGVSGFFIESFQIPPFLLPIYQAAGTAYGIPWQVLAAINEVETDYGRDLSVSSAGAEGWMQFLPSSWALYGVDATGAGYEDPYNPADAIFAAARYLRAAGGDTNIRAAVYAYNHSQAYVDTVMLRAQLLSSTPPELLGALTGLTESRFPVHAPAHFSDGFQTVPADGSTPARTLAGTTIYAPAGAPVIAVQDGEVLQVGDSPSLGLFVSLRDAYGNTYVYAELGSVATLYPVLEPREHTAVSARIAKAGGEGGSEPERAPSGPATAGAQPRSPLSESAAVSGFALGAAAGLEAPPASPAPERAPAVRLPPPVAPVGVRKFSSGPDEVYLHALEPGVQVLAGTVLGHVGAQTEPGGGSAAPEGAQEGARPGPGPGGAATVSAGPGPNEPHIFFQIKPAGAGAPLIDPKPILDGWVALESTAIFRARGENPFLATSPTAGQVLLEAKSQLQQQVANDASIHMRACARGSVQAGHVARPVLAMLEYLSVSGLKPTVAGLKCAGAAPAGEGNPSVRAGESVKIVAVNGIPIAGHQGQGGLADTTIRKLLMLQGLNRPRRIVSLTGVPGAANVFVKPTAGDYILVTFGPPGAGGAHAASAPDGPLTPQEWVRLIARLGEIPDPTVASGPSAAAIPDDSSTSEGGAGGHG